MPEENQRTHRYQLYKMGVQPEIRRAEYLNKINFWRSIENTYKEKRQQWLQQNSRFMSAQLAAENAKANSEAVSNHKSGDMAMPEDEEFSDVDAMGFSDPYAQYYSSLDDESRQRLKGELVSIYLRTNETAIQERQAAYGRRLLWAICSFVVLLSVACYVFVKMFSEPEPDIPPETQVCPGCSYDVMFPFEGLAKTLFPAANDMDEV